MAATYTVKQVADILGYSTNSIYTFLKAKRIKGVRVGKGRFRVPQSEINRLLLVKKGEAPELPTAQPMQERTAEGIKETISSHPVQFSIFGKLQVGMPNIFDWYIGIGAVVAGLAIYLFNKSFDSVQFSHVAPFIAAPQIILICGGIGVIATNIFVPPRAIWEKIFYALLGLAGTCLTILLISTGDIDGAFIYGSLTLVIWIAMMIPLGGIASFSLYITLLAISSAIVPIVSRGDIHVTEFILTFASAPWIMSLVLGILALMYIPALWWSYRNNRHIFWMCTWIAAIIYFALALWYANGQYWARSFFFIVTALAAAFLGPWEELQLSRNRKERLLMIGTLGSIGAILLIGVTVVYLMQVNIIATVKRENQHKVAYAQVLTQSILEGVESTLVGVASDSDLVAAVTTPDIDVLNTVSRTIMDSNPNIRRILILDAKGDGINIYPFGTFDEKNLAFRDYFIAARDTGKPYISNLFTALVDQANRSVISVAAPIQGKNNVFSGVIVASLDLGHISDELQKIAVPERKEYVRIVDSSGKIVADPDINEIGKTVAADDAIRQGTKGQGYGEGKLTDGRRAMVTYDYIPLSGWGIAIITPYVFIYELAATANLSVLGIVLACILIATIALQCVHLYWRIRRDT